MSDAAPYVDRVALAVRDATPSDLVPTGDGVDVLFRLYALLTLVKGTHVTTQDVHDAWSVWMADRDPSHESLVPFDDLPTDVRREDEPFAAAIRAVAAELSA